MTATLTIAEAASLEELLSRLDPDPAGVCEVPGCVHMHLTSTIREDVPALAA